MPKAFARTFFLSAKREAKHKVADDYCCSTVGMFELEKYLSSTQVLLTRPSVDGEYGWSALVLDVETGE